LRFSGKVWRHIPAGAHPLHAGFILKASGRWNRPGEYGCIYSSLTQEGAIAEYHKYLQRAAVSSPSLAKRRQLVSLIVEIDRVMDLTKGRSSPVSTSAPFLTGDDPPDIEDCRKLADVFRAQGYNGIIAPSAALSNQKNLMIYIDGPARSVNIDVGGDRIPI
jgi:RES domain-containing protein